MRIVYSPKYEVDIGPHVFPTSKYRLIKEGLLRYRSLIPRLSFEEPEAARDEDILLVHKKVYLDNLKRGSLSPIDEMRLELPYSPKLVEASVICAGGTIKSAKYALKDGISVHLGGGFHHAFSDHGEGFCIFNDIAIAIRRLAADGDIKRALVVDCDLHQGNGTASIFAEDKDIFTFSIHQQNNYPYPKPPGDMDIGLEDSAGDEEYLNRLNENVPKILESHKPQFIMYVAGSDPYRNDRLGGLSITMDGLTKRDELVYRLAKEKKIPIAVVLAGGYALEIEDTVKIHSNTVRAALSIFKQI